MKRMYCLALVMSLAVGCDSNDGSDGASEAGMTGGAPEAGVIGGIEIKGCAQSDSCSQFGLCIESIEGSSCIVTDESCSQSLACSGQGLCAASFDLASCVATEEGCAGSVGCAEEGLCELSSDESECVDISGRLGIEWVSIEGGSFMMGSTEGLFPESTTPVHSVTVIPFEITATEVTVAQYRVCVDQGRCSEPETRDGCNWNIEGRESDPINCVDWGQARTFAKWIGADVDLPTEAEWEYAARGGQDFIYAGSNDPDEVAWYSENSGVSTKPVGTKQANGYGLYDMSGNVWEWVLDEGHTNYEGAPTVSDEAWGEAPECDQVCDIGSARRVFRGGSWYGGNNDSYADLYANYLRVADRNRNSPDSRDFYLGFRVRRAR